MTTCTDGALCTWVFDQTGNQRLADVVDAVVGKPSALVGLILIGLVARWLLHRLIDRVIRRAEVGMLPDSVSRKLSGGRMGAALNMGDDTDRTGASNEPPRWAPCSRASSAASSSRWSP